MVTGARTDHNENVIYWSSTFETESRRTDPPKKKKKRTIITKHNTHISAGLIKADVLQLLQPQREADEILINIFLNSKKSEGIIEHFPMKV